MTTLGELMHPTAEQAIERVKSALGNRNMNVWEISHFSGLEWWVVRTAIALLYATSEIRVWHAKEPGNPFEINWDHATFEMKERS